LEFIAGIFGIIVAANENDIPTTVSASFFAAIMLLTSIVGTYANYHKIRYALMMFMIMNIWGVSVTTSYLYEGVSRERSASQACSLFGPITPICNSSAQSWMSFRVAANTIAIFACLFGSLVSLMVSEKLQDEAAMLNTIAISKHVKEVEEADALDLPVISNTSQVTTSGNQ